MKELISIIVPVYNVEPYLDRCIESIRMQTYENLQIILVDDGSTDKSGRICDTYEKLDKRIIVLHKENGGLSDARNFGLERADGDYIAFVDADDYIHSKMIERLLTNLNQTKADIAMCNLKYTYATENALEDMTCFVAEKENIILDQLAAQKMYFGVDKKIVITVVWNKLYKKYVFEEIRFPKGKIHEDEFITFQLLYKAKKIVYTDETLYYYFQKPDSIMGQFNKARFQLFEAYLTRMNFYSSHHEYALWKKMILLYIRMNAQYMQWVRKSNTERKDLFADNRKKLHIIYSENKHNVPFSLLEKLEYFLFFYSPPLYYIVWSIYKKYQKRSIKNRVRATV